MITYTQDLDMKHNLKAFKELVTINNYLTRYMDEYILMRVKSTLHYRDNYMVAFGKGKLDFGERIMIIRTTLWTDEIHMKDAVAFDKTMKDFRITKALLYPGEGYISVILTNTGEEVQLEMNNLDDKTINRIMENYHYFHLDEEPLKQIDEFRFKVIGADHIQSLRNNRTITEFVDGKALVFSKKILGSLNTTKDASFISLATGDSGMSGKVQWCIKEDIWEDKADKGKGLPYMETYMIVYAIDLVSVKGRE